MDNNTLLSELAAEIRALRRDALQIQPNLSEPDVRAVNAGIAQLTELLESFRDQPTTARAQAVEEAIGLAIDQRAALRNYVASSTTQPVDPVPTITEPAVTEAKMVTHRTPPGCLPSLLWVGGGILSAIFIPGVGWVIGPLMILITLFHPGTKSYHCANCNTALASNTAVMCPGCKADFHGTERSGSGSMIGLVIVVAVVVFILFLTMV